MQESILRQESGFTLIEIIAVLVILGFLVVVSLPKYMDLQARAKENATQAALGAGASEVCMKFANAILTGSSAPNMTSLAAILQSNSTTLGDYSYSYAASGDGKGVVVTVTAPTAELSPVNASKTVVLQ